MVWSDIGAEVLFPHRYDAATVTVEYLNIFGVLCSHGTSPTSVKPVRLEMGPKMMHVRIFSSKKRRAQ
jgi:hypothetical protein